MPWYKLYASELVFGDTVEGPGFRLDDQSGAGTDGWRKFPNETAACSALGVSRKVKGADRSALDQAIGVVSGAELKSALIALRDNDPDTERPSGNGAQSQMEKAKR